MYGRRNSSTGCAFSSASRPLRNAGVATRWSAGILRVASVRSLSGPLRRTSVRRSRIVGRARRRAGAARAGTARGPWSPAWTRRRARRGRRASRAGSRTSCWRGAASSAAGRAPAPARRSPSRSPARSRSCCRRAPARSSRFSASAVTSREESTMKRVRLPSSSVTSPTSRREVDSSGLKYSGRLAGLGPLAAGTGAAKPLTTSWRSPRVFSSSVLKIWSRSTTGRRRRGRQRRAVGQLLGAVGRGRERDVAVRDARQRRQPDRRLRPLAQRRVRLLDPDLDRGLVVVGQLDRADRAHAPAADLHVVVGHELPGVLEQQRVLGPAPAPEQQQPRGERDDQGECEDGGGAGDRHSIPSGPCDAPARNWRTNWLSELNSSSAGPDSTIRPFHSTAMYSATRLADMMSCVMTT